MSTASSEDPVTLIIPVRDTAAAVQGSLASIAQHTTSIPSRVLIVDRGSRAPGEIEDLAIQEHVRILRQVQDAGVPAAINLGVEKATTPLVAVFHPGLRVTRGWLERLLHHLRSETRAGVVVPSLSHARSAQRMDLGACRSEEEMAEAASHLTRRFAGQVEDVAFVESTCLVARREVLLEIGPFAQDLSHSSHWDADFCRRARKLGLRIVIARDAVAYYPPGELAESTEANQVEVVRNRLLLKKRWMDDPFFRGVEAATRNDHATAIGLFEQDLQREPRRPDSLVKMATSLHAANQLDSALHAIDLFLEHCPRSKDGLFVKAQILVGMSRSELALALLEEVERAFYVEPAEHKELLHTIASLHRLAKRPDRALEYLQRALDLGQGSADLYMTLIETAAETGQPSLFAGALESLVDADPRNVKLRLELGAALQVAGDVEGAKRAYRHAVKLDPKCEEATRQLKLLEGSS